MLLLWKNFVTLTFSILATSSPNQLTLNRNSRKTVLAHILLRLSRSPEAYFLVPQSLSNIRLRSADLKRRYFEKGERPFSTRFVQHLPQSPKNISTALVTSLVLKQARISLRRINCRRMNNNPKNPIKWFFRWVFLFKTLIKHQLYCAIKTTSCHANLIRCRDDTSRYCSDIFYVFNV